MDIKHAKKCNTNSADVLAGGGNVIPKKCDCDGYHTFDELYEHRVILFIALCRIQDLLNDEFGSGGTEVWKSKKHSDGKICFGTGTQFIMGITKEKGYQIRRLFQFTNSLLYDHVLFL